jgi:hypothetical protein
MNPFRFVPAGLLCLVLAETVEIFQGVSQIEHVNKTIGALSIVSASLHLFAFYLAWITVDAVREELARDKETPSQS